MTAMIDDFSLLFCDVCVKLANQYEMSGRFTIALHNHPVLLGDLTAHLRYLCVKLCNLYVIHGGCTN